MKLNAVFVTLWTLASMCSARPRFLAIPLDDIQLVQVTDLPLSRLPRHVMPYHVPESHMPRMPRRAVPLPYRAQPRYTEPDRQESRQYNEQDSPSLESRQYTFQDNPQLESRQYTDQDNPRRESRQYTDQDNPRLESRQYTDQDNPRQERQAHDHHQYVDYGAHTGHHGAFGWYADFPVITGH